MDKSDKAPKKKVKGVIPKSARSKKPSKKKSTKVKISETTEQSLSSQEESTTEDTYFPGGIETLLDVPNRKPLPHIPQGKRGPKHRLADLVLHAPKLYQKMIIRLRAGVSPNIAAEVCGIAERTFYEWGQKGAEDAHHYNEETGEFDPIDSFYSRFYHDVRRAIAVKAAECEEAIAEGDPAKWLSRGPGRVFGRNWGKNPEKTPPSQALSHDPNSPHGSSRKSLPAPLEDDAFEGTFSVNGGNKNGVHPNQGHEQSTSGPSQMGEELSGSTLKLTPAQEYEALQVWENIGQIQLSPEMKKAYEDQMSQSNVPTLEGEVEDEDE